MSAPDDEAVAAMVAPTAYDCGVRLMAEAAGFSIDAGRFYDALVLERSLRGYNLDWLDPVKEKVANHAAGVADLLAGFGFCVWDFDCEDDWVDIAGWDADRDYVYMSQAWESIWSALAASTNASATFVFEHCGSFWSDHICPGGGYTHTRLALRPVGEREVDL